MEISSIHTNTRAKVNEYTDEVLHESTEVLDYNLMKCDQQRNKDRIHDIMEAITDQPDWDYAKVINDFNSNKILVLLR